MEKSSKIMELVAAYTEFADAEELHDNAAGDAPATSPYCASAGASWLTTQIATATYNHNC